MKISKTPKREPDVPPDVGALCARITDADDAALPDVLGSVDHWPWPRGDLYTWVAVLNRFDALLARACAEHAFAPVQTRAFDAPTRTLLLAVLRFSRVLLENCMNRKLYASYEHLDTLLGTSDDAVREAVLYLVLRPAQQHSGASNPRHELPLSRNRLAVLAAVWPLREAGVELVDAVRDAPVAALGGVHMHYYRHAPEGAEGAAPAADAGLARVDVALPAERSAVEVYEAVAEREAMSDDERFELFQRIRIALAARTRDARRASVVGRALALACVAHLVPESVANARVFAAEPNLVARLVALLAEPGSDDYVQAAVLYALDGVAHYRGRLQEVLAALQASVSHGVLLEGLEGLAQRLGALGAAADAAPDAALDAYVDATMTLVAYVTTTVSGSSMVVGAGLVPRLLALAQLPADAFVVQRTASRAVGLLDSVMYAYPPAFAHFLDAHGLDDLVTCVERAVRRGAAAGAPLAHGRVALLRNLLKLFVHLMTTPGTAEGLRNLIDTPLVAALRGVLEARGVFGPLVLAQAIHIMATFVHNEPTLLATIQEQRLPEAFVAAIGADLEPNFELVSAATTAIGALCLNAPGLALVTQHGVVPHVLGVLDAPRHQKMLLDRDHAHLFGAAIDELVRHHPSLKDAVHARIADAIAHTLRDAEAFSLDADADDEVRAQYALLPCTDAPRVPPVPRVEDTALAPADTRLVEPHARDTNRVVGAFDVQCRFLEGLFRNPAHARDFLARGGLEQLLRFYGTPCIVYNFAATTPADSFVALLRVLADVRADTVLAALRAALHAALGAPALPSAEPTALAALLAPAPAAAGAANAHFRALVAVNVHAHLLADLCQTFAYAGPKLPLQLLQALTRDDAEGGATVGTLAAALRRYALPYVMLQAAAADVPRAAPHGDATTPLARNATALTYVGGQITASLFAILREAVRMLAPRRSLDAAYRTAAADAARALGQALAALLAPRTDAPEAVALAELAHTLHALTPLLLDERVGGAHVHTLLLTALLDAGGVGQLFAHLDALRAPLAATCAPDADADVRGRHALASEALRAGLELLLPLSQARAVLEAPHTSLLAQLGAAAPAPWEPHALLVRMRTDTLALVQAYWDAPWLPQLALAPLRALVQALLAVLHADAESPPKRTQEAPLAGGGGSGGGGGGAEHALFSSLAASLAARAPPPMRRAPPLRADPARVAQLVEMGFPRGAARRALERTHNNVSAATEYVLQHPELEDEPDAMETEGEGEGEGEGGAEGAGAAPVEAEAPAAEAPAAEAPAPDAPAPEAPTDDPAADAEAAAPWPGVRILSTDGDGPLAPLLGLGRGPAAPADAAPPSPAPPSPAKEALDAARAAFRPRVLARTLQLAETHEPLVFDAKYVFLQLAESEAVAALWAHVAEPLQAACAGAPAEGAGARRAAVWLHFAVLVLSTGVVQSQLPLDALRALLDTAGALLDTPAAGVAAEAPWLTSALLCVCGVVAACERPAKTELAQPPTPVVPVAQAALLDAARARALPVAQAVLAAHAHRSAEAVLAAYRLLVLATRAPAAAAAVGAGVPAVLAPLAHAERAGGGCDRLAMMVLRHVVEYAGPLDGVMDAEVHAFVTSHTRPRASEGASFSRGMAYAIERDVGVFLASAERQVEVLDLHEGKAQAFLRLRADAAPRAASGGEAASDALVHFLLDAVLAHEPGSEAYRFFVLQALTELVSSYMVCKQSFLRYGGDERGRAALGAFLTRLVPSGFLAAYDAEALRTRMAESNWAMSVLVALAAEPGAPAAAKSVPEPLVAVRKALLDAVSRALRDASQSRGEAVEVRYGRLYALADLCHRLLTAQPNTPAGAPAPKRPTEVALHMAKTMLEKNFVTLLTSALAEVDLNMPTVKALLDGMLRPLEHLTRVAMKMGKAAHSPRMHPHASRAASAMDEDAHDYDDASDESDAPDFYRNSALGMHTGEMEQGLEGESLSEDDEMDDEDDIEMDEYDSQHSELSTDEEGLDGDSAHVVEVMDEDDDEMDDEDDDGSLDDEDDDEDDDAMDSFDSMDDDSEVYEVDDEGMLPEHDFDYVVEDEDGSEHDARHTDDVGHLLEALDGMGQTGDAVDLGVDDAEGAAGDDDDDDDDDDLYDHGELSRLEIADDVAWPMHAHDDRFGARWNWLHPGRRASAPERPPTFFARRPDPPDADAGRALPPPPPPAAVRRPEAVEDEHPLLVDDRMHDERAGRTGGPGAPPAHDWQRNVEALVGGGTMQVLEMLLNRSAPPGTDTSIRIEVAEGGRGAPRMHIASVGGGGGAERDAPPAADGARTDDAAAQAYRFAPLTTAARWGEEARLVHGALMSEHALCVRNHLINALLPAYRERKAAEAAQRERDEAERRAREAERARMRPAPADTKRKLHDLEGEAPGDEAGDGDGDGDGGDDGHDDTSAAASGPRVTVMVHGEPVDLTDTGIDPTFLEALPDELREEALLSQQLAQRRAEPVGLARDFLEALPAPLRSEMAAHGGADDTSARAGAGDAARPDAEAARPAQSGGAPDEARGNAATGPATGPATAGTAPDAPRDVPRDAPRDAIQLLDRAGIATLVRLLYFPQIQTRSSALHKVLAHLAENAKTRADLLGLLLLVLADGSASIEAVDKSFAHMSSKAARTPQRGTPRRAAPGAPSTPSHSMHLGAPSTPATPAAPERAVAPLSHMGDEAPYLIAARTIETLMHLVQANDHAAAFFLCEEVRSRRKAREPRAPIHTLLGLLEHDALLANAQLVDALMALLNAITKPLASAHPLPEPPACASAPTAAVAVLSAPLAGSEVLPIAAERLASVVRPLRTAISSRGFQHTLAVAAHLARLRGARDVLSDALRREAERASAALVGDLDALVAALPPPDAAEAGAVRAAPLAKLASPTSAQAQLLRCLRALDYLYMGK